MLQTDQNLNSEGYDVLYVEKNRVGIKLVGAKRSAGTDRIQHAPYAAISLSYDSPVIFTLG